MGLRAGVPGSLRPASRVRLAEAVRGGGGTLGAGTILTHVPPPIASPFASAVPVEGDGTRLFALGGAAPPPDGAAFLDGIQRFAVVGRFGLVPVVRAYVAAAVLRRDGADLRVAVTRAEEFVAVPTSRLTVAQRDALETAGLPLADVETDDRAHPLLDVRAAAEVVERRRDGLERALAAEYLRGGRGWLVIDGSLGGLEEPEDLDGGIVGVVKSHETQFLHGRDLEAALTLPEGHRTSVFARTTAGRGDIYTWYLRQWPWEERDLLHGLLRIERPGTAGALEQATWVSRWLFGERTPLSAPDARWDRLLYPIHHVETFLRAQAGGTW